MSKEKTKWKSVWSGVAVGTANGLFGGGGGMLAVPLLRRLGYSTKGAHATAILVILPVCVFSFIVYLVQGFAQASVLVPTAIGVTVGGWLGAYFLDKLPIKIVKIIFIILQLGAGIYMLFF